MYLTYDEYKAYGGTLSDADFDRFAFRAGSELDNATFNRTSKLITIPECIKRCEYELVLYLSKNSKTGNAAAIASFSNDGYSATFVNPKTAQKEIYNIIYSYLSGTELMYRGTDEVEGYSFTGDIK